MASLIVFGSGSWRRSGQFLPCFEAWSLPALCRSFLAQVGAEVPQANGLKAPMPIAAKAQGTRPRVSRAVWGGGAEAKGCESWADLLQMTYQGL